MNLRSAKSLTEITSALGLPVEAGAGATAGLSGAFTALMTKPTPITSGAFFDAIKAGSESSGLAGATYSATIFRRSSDSLEVALNVNTNESSGERRHAKLKVSATEGGSTLEIQRPSVAVDLMLAILLGGLCVLPGLWYGATKFLDNHRQRGLIDNLFAPALTRSLEATVV